MFRRIALIFSVAFLLQSEAKADSQTARLGLTLISTGSTNWGTKLNNQVIAIVDSSAAALNQPNNFSAQNTFTQQTILGPVAISSNVISDVTTTLPVYGQISNHGIGEPSYRLFNKMNGDPSKYNIGHYDLSDLEVIDAWIQNDPQVAGSPVTFKHNTTNGGFVKIDDSSVTIGNNGTSGNFTAHSGSITATGSITAALFAGDGSGLSNVTATIAPGSIDTAKLATDSVITAKIINFAVDTSKLATDSVTNAKILNGTITADKLAFTPSGVCSVGGASQSVLCQGLSNTASGTADTVSGGSGNAASGGNSTIPGGQNVTVSGQWGVGAGRNNVVGGISAVISGGQNSDANAVVSTVGGGDNNSSQGTGDTVGGGENNTASGGDATIPGGQSCTASGQYSFATTVNVIASGVASVGMGDSAHADQNNCMVFNDGSGLTTCRGITQSFNVKASNGAFFDVSIATFTGSIQSVPAAAHAGQAACWDVNGRSGYCTSAIGAGGDCTCTGL